MAVSGGAQPTLYESTFSGAGAGGSYAAWNFSAARRPDAVTINLGTNDRPAAPATRWQQTYVSFVERIAALYGAPAPAFFLAHGPMTTEYAPYVINISATLVAGGLRAFPLNLTLDHPLTGCFGHPSAADNVEIAAKARPQVAAAMGWL